MMDFVNIIDPQRIHTVMVQADSALRTSLQPPDR
jgi:hypothetical protein